MGQKNTSFFTRVPGWTCQENRYYTKKERSTFCIRFVKNVIFICMFWYFFPCPCCRYLCTWESDISDTSWRKHFQKASGFLYEILHYLLSSFLPEPDIPGPGRTKNVLLVDASVVRQNGKKQEQQRIHMCYSLNQNRIYEVKVTDKHTAESLTHFSLKKDDLVMEDAGYGTAHNYIYAQEHQADVILRITPKNFCLYGTDGNKISLVQL